jgi:hypothetical protein
MDMNHLFQRGPGLRQIVKAISCDNAEHDRHDAERERQFELDGEFHILDPCVKPNNLALATALWLVAAAS